ncbi:MAG: hypothetical protein JSS75_03180 [Bacteroidetes bacterium]|nr:hypothetical protein [Bacteroidota bacterium]
MAQPQTLRLPPSLERELKLRGANIPRVIRFSDTVKADKIIAQSLRSNSGKELDSTMVHDSAIVTIDSAVSLSNKEWLDSMIAELPETERTPQGLRFHYPDRMMVTTARRQVPFDSSLPMRMDPVSKEDLPLFDELSTPKPVIAAAPPRYTLLVGVGTPYAPMIEAGAHVVSTDRSSIDVHGSYINRIASESPFANEWKAGATGIFSFPSEQIPLRDASPVLTARLGARSLSRDLVTDSGRIDAALTRSELGLRFDVGSTERLRASASADLSFFTDNAATGLSERHGAVGITMDHRASNSTLAYTIRLRYDGANAASSLSGSTGIGAATLSAGLLSASDQFIGWTAGASLILAADPVMNTTYLFPWLRASTQVTRDLSFYAELKQDATAGSYDELAARNPFYAPMQIAHDTLLRSLLTTDDRRAAIAKYQATLGASYFLSSDEYLRCTISFGTTHGALEFGSMQDSGAITRYYALPTDIHIAIFEADAAIEFFRNDRLTLDLRFASTRSVQDDKQLPFEPIVNAHASYTFGSLSEKLRPMLGVGILSRTTANYVFLNAGADYRIDERWSLGLRLENLLGSDGSFWVPYNENVRRARLTLSGSL